MSVDQAGSRDGTEQAVSGTFRHEVFPYADDGSFVEGLLPYLTEGLEEEESVVVVESSAKIGVLTDALGSRAPEVTFADMASLGRNPARIIPAWQQYLDQARSSGRCFRGAGEPIWHGRDGAELDECYRHEALLNTAFDGSGAWSLLCSYDTSKLSPEVVAEAESHHPLVFDGGEHSASAGFFEEFDVLGGMLPEPPAANVSFPFGADGVATVRSAAKQVAAAGGLVPSRVSDFVLAMHELAVNSLGHGGGSGTVWLWEDATDVYGEIRDAGVIREPLLGRVRPELAAERGRGLWLVQQLCDLVQIRSSASGSVIRVRMAKR